MRARDTWKIIAAAGLLASPDALAVLDATPGAVTELTTRGVSLLAAAWLICSMSNNRASREYRWVFSAATLAMGVLIAMLWNIGLFHALMFAMFGVPLGSIFAVIVLDVHERHAGPGSVLGVVLAVVFAGAAFLPSGAAAWDHGRWGLSVFLGFNSGLCYAGYRLGHYVQRRRGPASVS